jgi:hypothetical protein
MEYDCFRLWRTIDKFEQVVVTFEKQEGDASLHTARFYELYNRSPEVDLSTMITLLLMAKREKQVKLECTENPDC